MTFRFLLAALLLGLAAPQLSTAAPASPNMLTATEQQAGWKLLFDGKSLNGWRGFKKPGPSDHGWDIKDGTLTCVKGAKGGDIITDQTFDNFEFSWEWKMPPKSNNGVKYFITEERNAAIGHEYQLIDDSLVNGHAESGCASFYLVVAPGPAKMQLKPWGEWNHSRIVVQGDHVEHWLNGQKVLEYECGDPKILTKVAETKFKKTPGFGKKLKGHLLLTYHNDECSFRNIKVRELAP